MKVLVTGATGFIGGNLVRELTRQGYGVRALVRENSDTKYLRKMDAELVTGNLLDVNSLEKALDGCEALFHVAAMYTFWSRTPQLIYDTNVKGTRNLLTAAVTKKIKKIVYTSSESTVGITGHIHGNEDMMGCIDTIPGAYKKSKFIAENMVFDLCREGLPAVIVNPTTPVGAFDVKPTPTGQVIVDYLNSRMFACVNTGLNIVDVEDVAKGHILALEKGHTGQRYLLGNKNVTLRQMLSMLEEITGIKAPNVTIPIWFALYAGYCDEVIEGRIFRRYPRIPVAAVKASRKFRHFDCSKAVTELGLPQTPIEIAFKKAVEWFSQNGYVKDRLNVKNRKSTPEHLLGESND